MMIKEYNVYIDDIRDQVHNYQDMIHVYIHYNVIHVLIHLYLVENFHWNLLHYYYDYLMSNFLEDDYIYLNFDDDVVPI